MCFETKLEQDFTDRAKKLRPKKSPALLERVKTGDLFGFDHPYAPIVLSKEPDTLQAYRWGLLPNWAKSLDHANSTLNAKIETLDEKPSFKDYLSQRCLVLVNGFYEYQWLDYKGKAKQKWLMTVPEGELFAFAGLYNTWKNPANGELIDSFTIITTDANKQMSEIHNSAKRMPMVLEANEEIPWLEGNKIDPARKFEFITTKVGKIRDVQLGLF